MQKTRTEHVPAHEVEVLEDIICDSCGESCKVYESKQDWEAVFDYARLSANWGYCSGRDTERHSADICVKCFDNIIKKFKHPTLEE